VICKRVKQFDNKRVTQCSGCSGVKNGTLETEIINESNGKLTLMIPPLFIILNAAVYAKFKNMKQLFTKQTGRNAKFPKNEN